MSECSLNYRVLFITKTGRSKAPYLDPSVRYRCFNPAEVFVAHGIKSDVLVLENLDVSYLDNYDAFVFHRPDPDITGKKLAWFIEIAKARGKRLWRTMMI